MAQQPNPRRSTFNARQTTAAADADSGVRPVSDQDFNLRVHVNSHVSIIRSTVCVAELYYPRRVLATVLPPPYRRHAACDIVTRY